MNRKLTVAISGYGIAGVAAAIELRRLGHAVEHFERNEHGAVSGAGLLLHPRTLESLAAFGVGDAVSSVGQRVNRMVATTRNGREIMSLSYSRKATGTHGMGILRGTLMEILTRSDPGHEALQRGHSVVFADPVCGMLQLSNGSTRGPYDLVVAADGANSSIRRGLPRIVARDRLYDSAAVTIAVDDPDSFAGDLVAQHFDGTRHVSVWPVGSTEPGGIRKANVSINFPLARVPEALANGQWRRLAAGICPSLEPLFDLERCANTAPAAYSYRDVVLRSHVHGRVVFIGDAAHSMSPQLGQGACLALQDARRLAAELACPGRLETALERFNVGQRALIPPVQRASRWLTPIFQSDYRPLAMLRDALGGPVSRCRAVRSRIDQLLATA